MMAEYTYKDVIIDPEDQRLEIGAEYYFSNLPVNVVTYANEDNKNYLGKLNFVKKPDVLTSCCFEVQGGDYACLIRKKEASYSERQDKWIKENNLKVGDTVRIIREAENSETGWEASWTKDMSTFVGNLANVRTIDELCGILLSNGNAYYFFPYFVLEKVERKYVPFDLSKQEDREKLRGAWLKLKEHSNEVMVKAIYPFFNKVSIDNEEVFPDFLLENYEFLDGTPCGKLEVVE